LGFLGPLGINLPGLIAQMVNFLLLLGLLYLAAYRPILRMLDQRSARIKDSLERAEEIERHTARAEAEVKAQIEAARKEGQGIVAQAQKLGDQLKEEARLEARREAQALVERARGEIARERDEALGELRRQFADLAILAAEKVINESLDKAKHQRLIEEVLEEAGQLRGS